MCCVTKTKKRYSGLDAWGIFCALKLLFVYHGRTLAVSCYHYGSTSDFVVCYYQTEKRFHYDKTNSRLTRCLSLTEVEKCGRCHEELLLPIYWVIILQADFELRFSAIYDCYLTKFLVHC